jgi:hypothetical protein
MRGIRMGCKPNCRCPAGIPVGGDAKPGALVVGVPASHLYSEILILTSWLLYLFSQLKDLTSIKIPSYEKLRYGNRGYGRFEGPRV